MYRLLTRKVPIRVSAIWDNDANVWVATSNDVPGLITEAETQDELERKLQIIIPELLELNGYYKSICHHKVPFSIQSERIAYA
jgi:predicted RNase H-like HicB family nuclease